MESVNSFFQDDMYPLLHIGSSAIKLGRLQPSESAVLHMINSDYDCERSRTPSENLHLQALPTNTEPLSTQSLVSIMQPNASPMHPEAKCILPETTIMNSEVTVMHPASSILHSVDLTIRSAISTVNTGSLIVHSGSSASKPISSEIYHKNSTPELERPSKHSENSARHSVNVSVNHGYTTIYNETSGTEQESSAMHAQNSSNLFCSVNENVGVSAIEESYLETLNKKSDMIIEGVEEKQSSYFFNSQDLLSNDHNAQTKGSDMVTNTFSNLSEIPASQIGNEMLHHLSTKNHELSEMFLIENFSNFPHYVLKKDCTLSPGCSSIWSIELMIGKSTRRANCFELQGKLIRNGKENGTLRTNLQISLTDSNNQVLYDSVFSSLSSPGNLPSTSWFTMLLYEKHIYPLTDDKINVCLVLKVKDCCLKNISETIENDDDDSFNKMLFSFQNDLRSAYESKLLHDFCLVVGRETYNVNKFVLCARSPVFSNLFGQRTKPQTFYRLDPACKTKEVINAFLLYLYTGIIDDLDMDTACGLYITAKEFNIITLSPACGHIMLSKLTPDNACKVLILVHRNRDVFLKDAALRYIKKHITKIELTRDWQFLSRNLPILKTEIQTFFNTS